MTTNNPMAKLFHTRYMMRYSGVRGIIRMRQYAEKISLNHLSKKSVFIIKMTENMTLDNLKKTSYK